MQIAEGAARTDFALILCIRGGGLFQRQPDPERSYSSSSSSPSPSLESNGAYSYGNTRQPHVRTLLDERNEKDGTIEFCQGATPSLED